MLAKENLNPAEPFGLRDEFAGKAMAALMTTHKTVFHAEFVNWPRYAEEAYKIADAMLAERSK